MEQKKLAVALAACLSLGWAGVATASGVTDAQKEYDEALSLEPNLKNGWWVYLTCAVCHRPEGWGTLDGAYPQIAGQLPTVIIKQLADIRARNRGNPMMFPFSARRVLGGSQEIADVAAYIAQMPMTTNNGLGTGTDLAHGEQLYKDNCVDCHGAQGEGDVEKHIPAVAGQHYLYLLRQFEWIRTGRRRNADSEMVDQIRRFTPRDEQAVMDYVSRLKPSQEKLAMDDWLNPDFPNYVRPTGRQAPQRH